jgi:2-polyprenyl-6-methoxyphenol hydroxylase-like FAD-dependent oxidoreductase
MFVCVVWFRAILTDVQSHHPGPSESEYDVCVVGGGPAGASLTMRLAQLGRRVAIVEKMATSWRERAAESLSAGALSLLGVLGVRAAIESAGFLSSLSAIVDWAGQRRCHQLGSRPGLLVDRARFDAILLNAASALPGVHRYQPARAVSATRAGDQWIIALSTGETLRARYLAEASGRTRVRMLSESDRRSPRGALPRSRRTIGVPTLAICADWQRVSDCEAGSTLLEGGRDAWYWGALAPGGQFTGTVFVDRGAMADYDALIRKSQLLGPYLRSARRSGEVRICDATPFVDDAPITRASIKVGDAALAIDPLSSQGVQTAIGTAVHAAMVLNTMIGHAEDSELAIDFYRSRVRDSALFHSVVAADFYQRQAAVVDSDFWRRRAPQIRPKPPGEFPMPDSPITLSPLVQFAPVAVAGACRVVREDGVKLRGKAYAFVGNGIAIAPLLQAVVDPTTAFDVVRGWSRKLPAAQALQVLHWAWSEGLVCSAATS